MMKRVLVVLPLHPRALALLEERTDVVFEIVTDVSERNLLHHVRDADAITVRNTQLSAKVLSAAPNLRVISRHGVGYDNVPVDYCTSRGIPVAIVGSVNAAAVAEHTMFLMLAAARVGIDLDSAMRDGRFAARDEIHGVELRGKTLLLIGFGRIGREVASRARAFGLGIRVYDPYLSAAPERGIVRVGTLEEGLRQADIVSLHAPLTDETRRIIGSHELAMLPNNAIVVNAARGGLVDEDALEVAIASGRLHGAGLDVFEDEPLPVSSPLVRNRRIILSPHAASLTEDTLIAMGIATVANALAALDGRLDPELVVNREIMEK